MSHGESDSPTLADVEAVVRENVSGHVDGERHEQGKQRLLAAMRQGSSGGARKLRRILAISVGVGVLLSGGAYALKQQGSSRLTYDVSGGLLSDSGYVRGSGPSGARLSFSDGTRVDLQDGARARIAAVDAHGARLAIENGHAALNVAHLPHAAWYVDAGPFVIQVTGTQFDVDWSSYDDTLSVDLHEGTLVVSGPPAPTGVLLHAGQRLTAHEGRLSIEALEPAVQVAETPLPALDPLPDTDPLADPAPIPQPSGATADGSTTRPPSSGF
ncbi:MAG TPA: FecR family protein [Polyangiaceae bacterium]|nr:FecR family protein [Polyangiaceae bacterium]